MWPRFSSSAALDAVSLLTSKPHSLGVPAVLLLQLLVLRGGQGVRVPLQVHPVVDGLLKAPLAAAPAPAIKIRVIAATPGS